MPTARPPGVFWARTGLPAGAPLCEDVAHAVYRRRYARPRRGEPNARQLVEVWACAVCWPPTPQVQEQAEALDVAARRKGKRGVFRDDDRPTADARPER